MPVELPALKEYNFCVVFVPFGQASESYLWQSRSLLSRMYPKNKYFYFNRNKYQQIFIPVGALAAVVFLLYLCLIVKNLCIRRRDASVSISFCFLS